MIVNKLVLEVYFIVKPQVAGLQKSLGNENKVKISDAHLPHTQTAAAAKTIIICHMAD